MPAPCSNHFCNICGLKPPKVDSQDQECRQIYQKMLKYMQNQKKPISGEASKELW